MADYVVITTKTAKAWGNCPSHNYGLDDEYCPTRSEIENKFKCSIRTEAKSSWASNELVAAYDVYRNHLTCTVCNDCYSGQTTCNCNTGVCICNNAQEKESCRTNCNSHTWSCSCNACNNGVTNPCNTNCSHILIPGCISCNGTVTATSCNTNCSHTLIPGCISCNGTVTATPCSSNCRPHNATGGCTSCHGNYCTGCHSGQTNYECGGIEEV